MRHPGMVLMWIMTCCSCACVRNYVGAAMRYLAREHAVLYKHRPRSDVAKMQANTPPSRHHVWNAGLSRHAAVVERPCERGRLSHEPFQRQRRELSGTGVRPGARVRLRHDLGAERADRVHACVSARGLIYVGACAFARVARAREDRTPSSWSRRVPRARFSTALVRTQYLVVRVRDAHRCALTVLWRQLLHHHPEPSAARRRDI